jgi:ABC-2 type transport system permease protein
MSATTVMTTPPLPAGRTLRLGLSRIGYEVRTYFRQGDSVFFTFLFPLVFLTIFSVAFSNADFGKDATGHVVTAADYYLPAMLAAGLLLSGLQNMSIDICPCSAISSAKSARCSSRASSRRRC